MRAGRMQPPSASVFQLLASQMGTVGSACPGGAAGAQAASQVNRQSVVRMMKVVPG